MTSTNVNKKNNQPVKNDLPLIVDIDSLEKFPVLGSNSNRYTTDKVNNLDANFFVNKEIGNFRTKPCRNIINTGLCTRKKCTFAHSMEEWRVPICRYDMNCRYINGKINKFGNMIEGSICRFKHTYESSEEWLNRTGQVYPNLPLTNKKYNEKFVIDIEDEDENEGTEMETVKDDDDQEKKEDREPNEWDVIEKCLSDLNNHKSYIFLKEKLLNIREKYNNMEQMIKKYEKLYE